MNFRRWPRTDVGTVILHWIAVIAVIVLLLTGLRFASDDVDNVWLRDFDPYLGSENLWYRHMVAGYVLSAVAAGYAIYMSKGRLTDRIRLNAARLQGLFASEKMRWTCINVLLYWLFLVAALGACVTGWLAYYGAGDPVFHIHLLCTWVIIAFVALHLLAHLRLGGLPQVLRILRPKRIEAAPQEVDLAVVVSDLLAERRAAQLAAAAQSKRTS